MNLKCASDIYMEHYSLLKSQEVALKKLIADQSGFVVGDIVRSADPDEDQTERLLTWVGGRVETWGSEIHLYAIAKGRKRTAKGWHSVENDMSLKYVFGTYTKGREKYIVVGKEQKV